MTNMHRPFIWVYNKSRISDDSSLQFLVGLDSKLGTIKNVLQKFYMEW